MVSHRLDEYYSDVDDVSVETFLIKKPEIESDRQRVLLAISESGELTCRELAKIWGVAPNDISGRFTELRKDGTIIKVGKKYLPNSRGRMTPHSIYSVVKF